MSLLVALSRDHSGKPHKLRDRGAWGDLDSNGVSAVAEAEAFWTPLYLLHAEIRLIELGHSVYPVSDSRYSDRHDRVNTVGADVYVAGHFNSLTGGTRSGHTGNYAAIFCDHRSAPGNGLALANSIGQALGDTDAFPELKGNVRIFVARGTDWTKNAYSTIRGLRKPVGICFEPAFMDHADHRPLFTPDGMRRIGYALAEGIDAWGKARENT